MNYSSSRSSSRRDPPKRGRTPPIRTEHRLAVTNLSSRCNWQVIWNPEISAKSKNDFPEKNCLWNKVAVLCDTLEANCCVACLSVVWHLFVFHVTSLLCDISVCCVTSLSIV